MKIQPLQMDSKFTELNHDKTLTKSYSFDKCNKPDL